MPSGRWRTRGWPASLGFPEGDWDGTGVLVVVAGDAPVCDPLGGIGSMRDGLNLLACDFRRPPTLGGSLSALTDGSGGAAIRAAGVDAADGAGLALVGAVAETGMLAPGRAGLGVTAVVAVGEGDSELVIRDPSSLVGFGVESELVPAFDWPPTVAATGELVAAGKGDCASADESELLATTFDGASGGGVASDFIFDRA